MGNKDTIILFLADATFLEKQRNVLKTLVGLGADPADHDHVDFPYNKPELYKVKHKTDFN